MQFDNLLGDGQADPQAAVFAGGRGIRLSKSLKQVRQKGGINPLSGVGNGDLNVRVDPFEADLNPALLRSEFDRV